ncbi:MAG: penicillin-binding protein 2 [Propionibacteriaceae bacterium]|nr:penicillin-binding protein 2 [Propionibacteriaceae bacterium]
MSASRPAPRPRRRKLRIPVASSGKRIRIFAVLLAAIMMLSALRALQLQAFDPAAYAAKAEAQMKHTVPLAAQRGELIDRNGVVLAQSQPAVKVIADPEMIKVNGADSRYPMTDKQKEKAAQAPQAVAELLAQHLGGRAEAYLPNITVEGSKYQIVARRIPAYVFEQLQTSLREGGWWGIHSEPDPIRNYPAGAVASNVVGYINAEGVGSGLESALDEKLSGVPGTQTFEAARWGRIPLGTNVLTPAVDGTSYRLTLDSDLQLMAEQSLASGVARSKAATGTAIVMNVKTGEILVMANVPTFDANDPGSALTANLGNRAVTDAYEPGSVQKVLTMAALVDSGVADPETRLVVPGQIRSGSSYIKDAWSHGTLHLNARGMVAKSSNVAAVQLGRQLDKKTFAEYLKSFGLGAPTGVGLPGEAKGSIPGPDMADYTRDQISFGSGLSVTAVQMAAAVAGIVNGGLYHQPHVVAATIDSEGEAAPLPRPEPRRVISEESSAKVLDSMEAVITMGGATSLAIPGYRTAGKTGTAIRYDADCKCYNGYTASFVGVAPAEDPQILVYVVIDQPSAGHFGSEVAGPVYKEIMQVALGRYAVLPSSTPPSKNPIEYKP